SCSSPPPSTCCCLFFLLIPRPPRSPLFPYTTLFRSRWPGAPPAGGPAAGRAAGVALHQQHPGGDGADAGGDLDGRPLPHRAVTRSEEHTSELQSRENLVCRLLLEKKKKIKKQAHIIL